MYPWSRPYVPHAARPLQAHPLSTSQPACLLGAHTYIHTCPRARRRSHRSYVWICRRLRRRRISIVSRSRLCSLIHRLTANVWGELYVNVVIVWRVYACALKSGEQNSIEMYLITTKLRKLRFSLRATAINFSQRGIISPTSFLPRLPRRRTRADKICHLSRAILPERKKTSKGTEQY